MGPAPLPETGFLDDWAARLRQAADHPVVGIMLRGSHARRAATEHSDVDVDVLVVLDDEHVHAGEGPVADVPRAKPVANASRADPVVDAGRAEPVPDVSRAEPVPGRFGRPELPPAPSGATGYAARLAYLAEFDGRLVHVSVAARDVRSWVRRLGQPADWAFGLPVTAPAQLLWAAPEWRRRIDLPVLCQPADEPRLEELIGTLGKVAGARWADDPLGVRLAAADLARLCPSVLRLANPSVRVASRRAALAAVLDLPVAPPGFRDDLLRCLGLRPGGPAEVAAAAARLVTGIVPLVRPYAEEIAAVAGADLAGALVDGRLDRYLRQLTRALDRAAPATRDASPVPGPRAGEWFTVPASDAPVTGAPASPGPAPTPGPARPTRLDPAIAARLRRTPDGLVAAVVRQHDSGEVLMVAWMDDEALHRTLTTGRATYWSRSRQEYWVKGATSGHHQYVRSVALDCDGDALLVSVDQVGPACHTGQRSCFFTELPVSSPEATA